MRRKIGESRLKKGKRSPSMRNLLETSSVAQSLDGGPSDGESAFPRIVNLAIPEASGKFSGHSFLYHQYFGRCEFAHSRACSIGSRGGRIARNFRVVGKFSIRSRHRQNAGYLGYMALPSSVRLKANVLGRTKKSASVSSPRR